MSACPTRAAKEHYVASSLQFSLTGLDAPTISHFIDLCEGANVPIKWFGRLEPRGFTSSYADWGYAGGRQDLPQTREVLSGLCDMRIPLALSEDHCDQIAETIEAALKIATAGLRPYSAATSLNASSGKYLANRSSEQRAWASMPSVREIRAETGATCRLASRLMRW